MTEDFATAMGAGWKSAQAPDCDPQMLDAGVDALPDAPGAAAGRCHLDAGTLADLPVPAVQPVVRAPSAGAQEFSPPFEVLEPAELLSPLVFSSPHSGRIYPDTFLSASKLDPTTLRRSEDAFVDELFLQAPKSGAPLLRAHFPRAFLDVNREPWELDPAMFHDRLPRWVNTRSLRVASGLGTIAKSVSDGTDIYRDKLEFAEAERRIRLYYEPYHACLKRLIDRARETFGCAILIDCHSMPSTGGPAGRDPSPGRADIILGDRYATACSPFLTHAVADLLRHRGYRVIRNTPYAGGYCTEHYGDPAQGVHALQIEVKRSLYMHETRMERSARFKAVAGHLSGLIERLSLLAPDIFQPPR